MGSDGSEDLKERVGEGEKRVGSRYDCKVIGIWWDSECGKCKL